MNKFICPKCGKETEYKDGAKSAFCKHCGTKYDIVTCENDVKQEPLNFQNDIKQEAPKSKKLIPIIAVASAAVLVIGAVCVGGFYFKNKAKKEPNTVENKYVSGELISENKATTVNASDILTTIPVTTVTVPNTTVKVTNPAKVTNTNKPKPTQPRPKLPKTKEQCIAAFNNSTKSGLKPSVSYYVGECMITLENGEQIDYMQEASKLINCENVTNIKTAPLKMHSENIYRYRCTGKTVDKYELWFMLYGIGGKFGELKKGQSDVFVFIDYEEMKPIMAKLLANSGIEYDLYNSHMGFAEAFNRCTIKVDKMVYARINAPEIIDIPVKVNGVKGNMVFDIGIVAEWK